MKGKILIVDDNEMILEIMYFILTNNGYEVNLLNSGENVIKEVNQTHPDLIILDIDLGNIDGRDICKTLKENKDTQNLPVIICSGKDNTAQLLTQQSPPDAILNKPFDLTDFIAKVEHQLAA